MKEMLFLSIDWRKKLVALILVEHLQKLYGYEGKVRQYVFFAVVVTAK